MATFKYQARTISGQLVKGFIEAKEEKEAIRRLKERQLIPVKIYIAKRKKIRISSQKIIDFTIDLKDLLEGGLSLDRALEMLMNSAEKLEMKHLIADLLESVKAGKSFSEALSQHHSVFGRFYIQMIRVGEMTGSLTQVLKLIGDYLEARQKLKENLISVAIYPSILLTIGIISIFILLGYVVPRFSQIFSELHQEVPIFMKFLLKLGYFLNHYGWLFPFILILLFFILKRLTNHPHSRYRIHEMLLKVPYLREIIIKIELIKFTRTMGILLHAGVDILEAIEIAKDVMTNEILKKNITQLKQEVRSGKNISLYFKKEIFPPKMSTILAVSEETGDLGEGFLNVNKSLESEMQRFLKRGLSLIEPTVIVIMGIIIGLIIFSMFSAILGINEIKF